MLVFSMTWFSSPTLLFFLYSVPTIYIILSMLHLSKQYLVKWTKLQPTEEFLVRINLHAMSMVFASVTLLLTIFGFNSAYIFSTNLLFPAAWWVAAKYMTSYNIWKSFHLKTLLQIVPLTMWSYM